MRDIKTKDDHHISLITKCSVKHNCQTGYCISPVTQCNMNPNDSSTTTAPWRLKQETATGRKRERYETKTTKKQEKKQTFTFFTFIGLIKSCQSSQCFPHSFNHPWLCNPSVTQSFNCPCNLTQSLNCPCNSSNHSIIYLQFFHLFYHLLTILPPILSFTYNSSIHSIIYLQFFHSFYHLL